MIYTIRYEVKVTNSNNTYYQLESQDTAWLIEKLIRIQSFLNELSLAKDPDLKSFVKWYSEPNKVLPFSTHFKRRNSPQSYVAGMLNNLLFSQQSDIVSTQATHLEYIINSYMKIEPLITLNLQVLKDTNSVEFKENIWSFK